MPHAYIVDVPPGAKGLTNRFFAPWTLTIPSSLFSWIFQHGRHIQLGLGGQLSPKGQLHEDVEAGVDAIGAFFCRLVSPGISI